eukprot:GGOE01036581.1.p1 GENE.GGOE01036581.1~~GGOE01036581.1.p1  ORF type:complete len:483 (+),score=145.48 GGOE01036581.1:36-1451(+)
MSALCPEAQRLAGNWAAGKQLAERMVRFINQSPSPFHAVQTCVQRLEECGFERLSERQVWPLQRKGKYFFTRNRSSVVAFAIGGKYDAKNGLKIVGAHSDSPNLQVKPVSATSRVGFQQVSVSTYGGGLWHTWFDRDLTVAGRVLVRSGDKVESRLVHIPKPILRVPNLCIHLQSAEESAAFKVNKEDHICPILCTTVAAELEGAPKPEPPAQAKHQPALLQALAESIGCKWDEIVDFDLSVCDTQPAAVQGLYDEFVCAPRIDNLASCFCALEALVTAEGLEEDPQCRVIALFDNEEVGSESYAGAGCTHLASLISRLAAFDNTSPAQIAEVSAANSFILSVDCAHAVHPCYAGKHHELLRPEMHKGVVMKFNANQRYATNAIHAAPLRELSRLHAIPLQDFAVRNDTPCGSTIGPISATRLGIRTVDIGLPELSMHSIRETCGTTDVLHLKRLIEVFFSDYHKLQIDEQ